MRWAMSTTTPQPPHLVSVLLLTIARWSRLVCWRRGWIALEVACVSGSCLDRFFQVLYLCNFLFSSVSLTSLSHQSLPQVSITSLHHYFRPVRVCLPFSICFNLSDFIHPEDFNLILIFILFLNLQSFTFLFAPSHLCPPEHSKHEQIFGLPFLFISPPGVRQSRSVSLIANGRLLNPVNINDILWVICSFLSLFESFWIPRRPWSRWSSFISERLSLMSHKRNYQAWDFLFRKRKGRWFEITAVPFWLSNFAK